MSKSILIVEPSAIWASTLKRLISPLYEKVEFIADYGGALEAVTDRDRDFSLLITEMCFSDEDLTDTGPGQILVHQFLKNHPYASVIAFAAFDVRSILHALPPVQYLEKGDFETMKFIGFVEEATAFRTAFVLMPFKKEYQYFYEEVIKKAFLDCEIETTRADNNWRSTRIIADIVNRIRNADMLIADLSDGNPNVLYEVGYAHAIGIIPWLISRSLDDVPPGLRSLRIFLYEDTVSGAKAFERFVRDEVCPGSRGGVSAEPIFNLSPSRRQEDSCVVILPDGRDSNQVFSDIIDPATRQEGLRCQRADSIFDTTNRMNAIWRAIHRARILIADVTEEDKQFDPQVLYLIGLAHGLGKDVLFLNKTASELPFDLREAGQILYAYDSLQKARESQVRLRERIRMLMQVTPEVDWVGPVETDELERIVSQRGAFHRISFFSRGDRAARSVCLVENASVNSIGTGFLIGPRHVLTNSHVLHTDAIALDAQVRFDFRQNADGSFSKGEVFQVEAVLKRSRADELDYLLLKLAQSPVRLQREPLRMSERTIEHNMPVFIIQHPKGGDQMIVLEDSYVVHVAEDGRRVQYLTNTLPGSSGSPVCDENWEVIAIHHAGEPFPKMHNQRHISGNEGIPMRVIYPEIEHLLR